ncbi:MULTISPECIES: amidohydrolase [Proteus]|jgi:aminobenzoyl-glutamate utilization protein A|uniref:Putative aminohydrolase n=1 Tax=Proteus vulgaris TaxID=585 RepID=A0A379F4Z6_PROVU|nr:MULTISPECIES: amidohydrolase [Proteus]NBN61548.1 amidohydrolase [Proteus sp. G2639]RNT26603.1 amidohydrolase [Proteus mirabilis]KGA59590.1 aminobenzoyl-glutamate utilization protein [Proteus vulgaris]MBG5971626.1 amidohydrolase [Proteus vulgaris]MBW3471740.1 amidohydrolase [Proteus vulgaris]
MKPIQVNKLIEWRRAFHQFPEIGWAEFVTTGTIITLLRDMDIEVKAGPHILCRESILGRDEELVKEAIKIAKEKEISTELLTEMDGLTGCMAIIDTEIPGPTFAFRFDIDCVYVQESNDENHLPNKQGFASCRSGLMHACGHDGHTAIGLGLAHWLKQNIHVLRGKYKLIFQPAEEGVRGARAISDSGILDDTDYFMGMHIGCNLKKGEVALDPFDFLCTTKLDIFLKGKVANATDEPEKGTNALVGACFLANEILATPRHGKGMTRVNVGTLIAGENRSLIPSSAKMQLEVRGQDAEITKYLFDNIKKYTAGIASAYHLETKIEVTGEATNFRNDPEMINLMQAIIDTHPELLNVTLPLGGSEDVSLMVRRVQEQGGKAIFFLVGADQSDGHHKEKFDIDEEALSIGLTLFTEGILSILNIPN